MFNILYTELFVILKIVIMIMIHIIIYTVHTEVYSSIWSKCCVIMIILHVFANKPENYTDIHVIYMEEWYIQCRTVIYMYTMWAVHSKYKLMIKICNDYLYTIINILVDQQHFSGYNGVQCSVWGFIITKWL